MSWSIVIPIVVAGIGLGAAVGYWLPPHGRRPARQMPEAVHRILLPFTGNAISKRALEAAVRLAKAEDATIMPAFLAEVPLNLPVDAPLPRQCMIGMPLLEAIEQSATAQGARVDARVSRGRSFRDALRQLIEREPVDRIIVSATDQPHHGLTAEDLEWLLDRVPAEVLILRPAASDDRELSGERVTGHF